MAFSLIPDEPKQALRMQRFFMAFGTAALVISMLIGGAWVDLLPWTAAVHGLIAMVALGPLFFLIFRAGFNLRFADPSLTTELCAVSILVFAYLLLHADRVRSFLIVVYPVILLFGVFRLGTARLLMLAALALVAHGFVLWMAGVRSLEARFATEIGQFVVLLFVLPWFAVMGGYVSRLRARLTDSNRQLQAAVKRIEQIAIHDDLTGVFNRRFLIEALQHELARATRQRSPLAVCLFDLDHFKQVNDTHGHAAGDAVLKRFTEIARSGLRGVDILSRQGGEEFMLVLPDTDLAGAQGCAERIRANVEQTEFPGIPASHRITVTSGVACVTPTDTLDTLLARADAALYRGKEAGRNRIVAMD